MGGMGSGRWGGHRKALTVEEVPLKLALDRHVAASIRWSAHRGTRRHCDGPPDLWAAVVLALSGMRQAGRHPVPPGSLPLSDVPPAHVPQHTANR